MSHRTEPAAPRPYSIAPASICDRLRGGEGLEHARLLWLVILSHTPWDTLTRSTWATNVTLTHEAGLATDAHGARKIERALAHLREAGMLATPTGPRPRAKRKTGRLLVPAISAPVRILTPDRGEVANLWVTCREVRERPAALVTLMVGAHVMAAHGLDRRPTGWARVPGPAADLRRFVGASKGSTWNRRLRDLESIGLVSRPDGLWVAPPSEWSQAWRALRRIEATRLPPAPMLAVEVPYAGESGVWEVVPDWA